MGSSFSEPTPRWGHYSAAVGEELFVVQGLTKDFSRERVVHVFNQHTETWQTKDTKEMPHPGVHTGACASRGCCLYFYGGFDGSVYQNSLHQLDTDSMKWSSLPMGPSRTIGCKMVPYENKLILIDGYYGLYCENHDSNLSPHHSQQLHCFDLKNGMQKLYTS